VDLMGMGGGGGGAPASPAKAPAPPAAGGGDDLFNGMGVLNFTAGASAAKPAASRPAAASVKSLDPFASLG